MPPPRQATLTCVKDGQVLVDMEVDFGRVCLAMARIECIALRKIVVV